MSTAGSIITEIRAELAGYGETAERFTTLTNDLAPLDVQFKVDVTTGTAMGIAPGAVEVDSELIFVSSVDAATGICTTANGVGRGFNGTNPVPHNAGSMVTISPRYPRKNILTAMNDVIGGLFPDIVAINTFEGVITFPGNTYTFPTRPIKILEAQWQDPLGHWLPLDSYTIDQFDGSFRLWQRPMIGRPLRVTYSTQPVQFSSEDDDFLVTGLPSTCEDLVRIGAIARMAVTTDLSRTQISSVEQGERSKLVQLSAGISVAGYMQKLFQDRLRNESESQRRSYPPRIRRSF